MASQVISGEGPEGPAMSDDSVTQPAVPADRGDAVSARNQLSQLSITASGERKRIRDLSPQEMMQFQRRKVTSQSSFSPHLLQTALGQTSIGQPRASFPSSANSSLYTNAPLRGSVANGLTMNPVALPSAARARAPSMTRMFQNPSASAAAFIPPTHTSNMSLASRSSAMMPTAFANNHSFPVVAPQGPIQGSLANSRPRTFMPSLISAAAPTASSGTRHTGVAGNIVPTAFANTSFSVISPEGSLLTSVFNYGHPLMSRPIVTAPTASARTVPHNTGVARSPYPAVFANTSISVVSAGGSILTSVTNLGHPLMPQAINTASRPFTPSAWPAAYHTGISRNTFPAAFAGNSFSAVSPGGTNLTSMATSGPPTPMPPHISAQPTASARTVPCHTGLATSPVPAFRGVVPGAITPSANTPAPALGLRRTSSDVEALEKALLARASLAKASSSQTATQGHPMMSHIKWQGSGTPETLGVKCMLCKRDLSYTPDGPVYIPSMPVPVAVLPCGHTFHDQCLQRITREDQSKSPPCISCAGGEN